MEHLVCEHPTPPFLLFLLDAPIGTLPDERLHVHLARGGSLREAVRSGLLPTVLTRRMRHLFTRSPIDWDVVEAVRRAQVRASGGAPRLADAVVGSFLGRDLTSDEGFWISVIQWLCRQPDLDLTRLDLVLDWIRFRRNGSPDFSVRGRTARSALRDAEAWHVEMSRLRRAEEGTFSPSGFREDVWEVRRDGRLEVWSCEEILSLRELLREGREMRHCVYSYADLIRSGQTSIWSLRRDGRRQLTVEVSDAHRQVVQARGPCNVPATSSQMRELTRWASLNGLTVSAHL